MFTFFLHYLFVSFAKVISFKVCNWTEYISNFLILVIILWMQNMFNFHNYDSIKMNFYEVKLILHSLYKCKFLVLNFHEIIFWEEVNLNNDSHTTLFAICFKCWWDFPICWLRQVPQCKLQSRPSFLEAVNTDIPLAM